MRTVFITQHNPDFNFLKANAFGKLEFLLPAGRQLMHEPQALVTELRDKLLPANDGDLLLCVGDPSVIGLASAIMSEYLDGHLTFLKWDRQSSQYYEVAVDALDRPMTHRKEKVHGAQ